MLLLLVWCVFRRRLPDWPWIFLAVVGAAALLFALPLADPLRQLVPGTLLRSPARLLYLTTFSAAALLGFAVDKFRESDLLPVRLRQPVVCLGEPAFVAVAEHHVSALGQAALGHGVSDPGAGRRGDHHDLALEQPVPALTALANRVVGYLER
jgi:hypothetical protein